MKILENTAKNGIEIYFESIPKKEILNKLKENLFKWHAIKKCWYARATEKARELATSLQDEKAEQVTATAENLQQPRKQQNTLQLKTLRTATEEERIQIAKEQWQDEKMQQYLLNTYDYYFTQDGYILEFEKASKRAITKELYYDDEYDAPQVNLFNFMQENKHNGLVNAIEQTKKNLTIDFSTSSK